MGNIPSFSELKAMSDKTLIERYDGIGKHTVVGTQFYLDELMRREQRRQSDQMLGFTKQMRNMTTLIFVLTLVNAALVAVTVFGWTAS